MTMTKLSANGITIEVDLTQILTAIDPQGKWLGYNPETDEEAFVASSLEQELVHATSTLLVKSIRKEVVTMVQDEVRATVQDQIRDIIAETLASPIQRTNEFGGAVGTPTPLTEMIMQSAQDALTKATGDSYGRRPTVIQKIVDDMVGNQFKAELQKEVATAKAQALAAVKNQAGEVIAEAVRRATPGL